MSTLSWPHFDFQPLSPDPVRTLTHSQSSLTDASPLSPLMQSPPESVSTNRPQPCAFDQIGLDIQVTDKEKHTDVLGVEQLQARAATKGLEQTPHCDSAVVAHPPFTTDDIFNLNLSSITSINQLYAMDPNWSSQPVYNYYTPDLRSSTDRQANNSSLSDRSPDHSTHRRLATHPMSSSSFLPPPPPHSASSVTSSAGQSGMNLPPFSQTFYQAYHSTGAQSAPANVHALPHGLNYSSHVTLQGPNQGYQYPMASPVSLNEPLGSGPRAPPPHSYSESPRMPPFSSSPGLHHLSPTSPTTHMGPPGIVPSSASTSSSSFPSISRTPVTLPKSMKRMSDSSNDSWEENGSRYMPGSAELDLKELDDQPWGMPQDEYKALNPRDKKQVRNRIGARRFRAKRKDYVSTLEGSLRDKDDENAQLRAQNDAYRAEINTLRGRLNMPQLSPPQQGLGLLVGSASGGIGHGTGVGTGTGVGAAVTGGVGARDGWGDSALSKSTDGEVAA